MYSIKCTSCTEFFIFKIRKEREKTWINLYIFWFWSVLMVWPFFCQLTVGLGIPVASQGRVVCTLTTTVTSVRLSAMEGGTARREAGNSVTVLLRNPVRLNQAHEYLKKQNTHNILAGRLSCAESQLDLWPYTDNVQCQSPELCGCATIHPLQMYTCTHVHKLKKLLNLVNKDVANQY